MLGTLKMTNSITLIVIQNKTKYGKYCNGYMKSKHERSNSMKTVVIHVEEMVTLQSVDLSCLQYSPWELGTATEITQNLKQYS